MNVYNSWSSPQYNDAWTIFQDARTKIKTIEDVFEWNKDPTNRKAQSTLTSFFEGVGVLVRQKLVNIELVAQLITGSIVFFYFL